MAMPGERTQEGTVYDIILRQHLDLRRMLVQLEEQGGRQQLDDLRHFITAHERAEESTIFHDLFYEQEMKDLVFEMTEEHHVADGILEELMAADPGSDRFRAKTKVFKEIVEQHLNEEESEFFPMAQLTKDDDWARDMAPIFARQEERHAGDTGIALPEYR